ncbi:AraC family transcriptional regulator [Sinirhodobacter populi]|uniref:AraC family transcriptional regulator n=1 Tax=Paenirhodobacter populi TaxID=2306993 RepID=A0A443K6M3_9RHOB|nr:AraC family transcriptional regulator [Sinirhodobacter populi]RWR28404.1 AraC family transcriptional regulator [Sinirhodobacter populi]
MGYLHSMTCRTEGIRPLVPVRWRGLDGLVSVFWEAEGRNGAHGYYVSPDPRIVFFFNDVSSHILMSNRDGTMAGHARPMTRAVYVPAGVPLWTSFTADHRFSHLDVHIHRDRLLRFLTPSVGASAALAAMKHPVEIQDVAAIEALARLLVEEVSHPLRHAVYAESLVGSIVAGLLDLPPEGAPRAAGGLTAAQMRRLTRHVAAHGDRRLSVGEMAAMVGLSESWFSAVFRKTTGKTPLQWQTEQRIDAARRLLLEGDLPLADIAARLGFSDQAHLTKTFRRVAGETPAAWRRQQQAH